MALPETCIGWYFGTDTRITMFAVSADWNDSVSQYRDYADNGGYNYCDGDRVLLGIAWAGPGGIGWEGNDFTSYLRDGIANGWQAFSYTYTPDRAIWLSGILGPLTSSTSWNENGHIDNTFDADALEVYYK